MNDKLKKDSKIHVNEINIKEGHPRKKWHREAFELTWQNIKGTSNNEMFNYKNDTYQQKVIDYLKSRQEQHCHRRCRSGQNLTETPRG